MVETHALHSSVLETTSPMVESSTWPLNRHDSETTLNQKTSIKLKIGKKIVRKTKFSIQMLIFSGKHRSIFARIVQWNCRCRVSGARGARGARGTRGTCAIQTAKTCRHLQKHYLVLVVLENKKYNFSELLFSFLLC